MIEDDHIDRVDLFSDYNGHLSDTNIFKSFDKELITERISDLRTTAGAGLKLLPSTTLDDIMP